MNRRRLANLWVLSVLSAAIVFSAGCAANKEITPEMVRRNMSPGLESLANTYQQRENNRANAWDVNGRSAWDDIDKILFNDRPMRLSIYTIH